MATVVDYARINRLLIPDEPAISFGTKVYMILIAMCTIFLVKKWRDKQLSSSVPESEKLIIYPSERDGL